MTRALYPGTFDPITLGHLDVIERAATLFEFVEVAVGINSQKTSLFTAEERKSLIQENLKKIPNVQVSLMHGLTVEYLKEKKCQVIVRGLRAVSDFEFEFQMALMNRKLNTSAETILLLPKEEYTYLNSTVVREIARMGGDVSSLVPQNVQKALVLKFGADRVS